MASNVRVPPAPDNLEAYGVIIVEIYDSPDRPCEPRERIDFRAADFARPPPPPPDLSPAALQAETTLRQAQIEASHLQHVTTHFRETARLRNTWENLRRRICTEVYNVHPVPPAELPNFQVSLMRDGGGDRAWLSLDDLPLVFEAAMSNGANRIVQLEVAGTLPQVSPGNVRLEINRTVSSSVPKNLYLDCLKTALSEDAVLDFLVKVSKDRSVKDNSKQRLLRIPTQDAVFQRNGQGFAEMCLQEAQASPGEAVKVIVGTGQLPQQIELKFDAKQSLEYMLGGIDREFENCTFPLVLAICEFIDNYLHALLLERFPEAEVPYLTLQIYAPGNKLDKDACIQIINTAQGMPADLIGNKWARFGNERQREKQTPIELRPDGQAADGPAPLPRFADNNLACHGAGSKKAAMFLAKFLVLFSKYWTQGQDYRRSKWVLDAQSIVNEERSSGKSLNGRHCKQELGPMADASQRKQLVQDYGAPIAHTLLCVEDENRHYSSFILKKLRREHMVSSTGKALKGEDLLKQLATMLPDIYDCYLEESELQNQPRNVRPDGMPDPVIRLELFLSSTEDPEFDAVTGRSCSLTPERSILLPAHSANEKKHEAMGLLQQLRGLTLSHSRLPQPNCNSSCPEHFSVQLPGLRPDCYFGLRGGEGVGPVLPIAMIHTSKNKRNINASFGRLVVETYFAPTVGGIPVLDSLRNSCANLLRLMTSSTGKNKPVGLFLIRGKLAMGQALYTHPPHIHHALTKLKQKKTPLDSRIFSLVYIENKGKMVTLGDRLLCNPNELLTETEAQFKYYAVDMTDNWRPDFKKEMEVKDVKEATESWIRKMAEMADCNCYIDHRVETQCENLGNLDAGQDGTEYVMWTGLKNTKAAEAASVQSIQKGDVINIDLGQFPLATGSADPVTQFCSDGANRKRMLAEVIGFVTDKSQDPKRAANGGFLRVHPWPGAIYPHLLSNTDPWLLHLVGDITNLRILSPADQRKELQNLAASMPCIQNVHVFSPGHEPGAEELPAVRRTNRQPEAFRLTLENDILPTVRVIVALGKKPRRDSKLRWTAAVPSAPKTSATLHVRLRLLGEPNSTDELPFWTSCAVNDGVADFSGLRLSQGKLENKSLFRLQPGNYHLQAELYYYAQDKKRTPVYFPFTAAAESENANTGVPQKMEIPARVIVAAGAPRRLQASWLDDVTVFPEWVVLRVQLQAWDNADGGRGISCSREELEPLLQQLSCACPDQTPVEVRPGVTWTHIEGGGDIAEVSIRLSFMIGLPDLPRPAETKILLQAGNVHVVDGEHQVQLPSGEPAMAMLLSSPSKEIYNGKSPPPLTLHICDCHGLAVEPKAVQGWSARLSFSLPSPTAGMQSALDCIPALTEEFRENESVALFRLGPLPLFPDIQMPGAKLGVSATVMDSRGAIVFRPFAIGGRETRNRQMTPHCGCLQMLLRPAGNLVQRVSVWQVLSLGSSVPSAHGAELPGNVGANPTNVKDEPMTEATHASNAASNSTVDVVDLVDDEEDGKEVFNEQKVTLMTSEQSSLTLFGAQNGGDVQAAYIRLWMDGSDELKGEPIVAKMTEIETGALQQDLELRWDEVVKAYAITGVCTAAPHQWKLQISARHDKIAAEILLEAVSLHWELQSPTGNDAVSAVIGEPLQLWLRPRDSLGREVGLDLAQKILMPPAKICVSSRPEGRGSGFQFRGRSSGHVMSTVRLVHLLKHDLCYSFDKLSLVTYGLQPSGNGEPHEAIVDAGDAGMARLNVHAGKPAKLKLGTTLPDAFSTLLHLDGLGLQVLDSYDNACLMSPAILHDRGNLQISIQAQGGSHQLLYHEAAGSMLKECLAADGATIRHPAILDRLRPVHGPAIFSISLGGMSDSDYGERLEVNCDVNILPSRAVCDIDWQTAPAGTDNLVLVAGSDLGDQVHFRWLLEDGSEADEAIYSNTTVELVHCNPSGNDGGPYQVQIQHPDPSRPTRRCSVTPEVQGRYKLRASFREAQGPIYYTIIRKSVFEINVVPADPMRLALPCGTALLASNNGTDTVKAQLINGAEAVGGPVTLSLVDMFHNRVKCSAQVRASIVTALPQPAPVGFQPAGLEEEGCMCITANGCATFASLRIAKGTGSFVPGAADVSYKLRFEVVAPSPVAIAVPSLDVALDVHDDIGLPVELRKLRGELTKASKDGESAEQDLTDADKALLASARKLKTRETSFQSITNRLQSGAAKDLQGVSPVVHTPEQLTEMVNAANTEVSQALEQAQSSLWEVSPVVGSNGANQLATAVRKVASRNPATVYGLPIDLIYVDPEDHQAVTIAGALANGQWHGPLLCASVVVRDSQGYDSLREGLEQEGQELWGQLSGVTILDDNVTPMGNVGLISDRPGKPRLLCQLAKVRDSSLSLNSKLSVLPERLFGTSAWMDSYEEARAYQMTEGPDLEWIVTPTHELTKRRFIAPTIQPASSNTPRPTLGVPHAQVLARVQELTTDLKNLSKLQGRELEKLQAAHGSHLEACAARAAAKERFDSLQAVQSNLQKRMEAANQSSATASGSQQPASAAQPGTSVNSRRSVGRSSSSGNGRQRSRPPPGSRNVTAKRPRRR